ncbi:nitrite/sulfite reductase [Modestobacter versicolor]|uniref:assimilatory sulfite reductase (ferredoxin) n=1 Tax=Modestobacter versicolor TaxID=429133 RepID=A0A323VUZ3_9ACTN|nr:nitrite/sulfite reductase [Modestobacter versicolor]MBB3676428.1 sulfite reductase (ferredoxin) [Modestobacter versicolor]PZA22658.1 nitrite/sulfite reductase [Modestobacter versicolor]
MSTPTRSSSRPQRGQGQWALGYREPLNPNERMKKDSDGLDVRQRILDIYAHTGFDGIDPGDLRGRMRWMGLYTQRAQGIPGGKTAVLEPEELEDSYFMLRVRIDGGQLSTEQLRVIGGISTEFGRDVADVTDRQNVQLHWIRIEDVPEIWRRLEQVGLSSTEACGDVPRVMLNCPLAGVLEDEIVDASAVLAETVEKYLGDREFSNLPRKWKTSMSGCVDRCTEPEIDDVSFNGVVNADGEVGYDLWVGGGLSTNPMFAKRIGVFVRPEQVSDVWAACTSIFRDYGYRRSRNHARIKFLMADWGPEKFRQVLEDEYLHAKLPDGPAAAPPKHEERDHVGVSKQKDGANALGFALRTGRLSGTLLTRIADLAEEFGGQGGRIRTTTQQKLVILDVPDERVEELVAALAEHDLLVRPSAFRRGTMACTGLEFCKLAIVETKAHAQELYAELERRLPGFDEPIGINVNGCPNSCARFQTADIGFKGMIVRNAAGESVEGFQVHLGGHLGVEASFGRKFRGHKITKEETADYCERVLRGYLDRRTEGERFASYVARAEEEWLL